MLFNTELLGRSWQRHTSSVKRIPMLSRSLTNKGLGCLSRVTIIRSMHHNYLVPHKDSIFEEHAQCEANYVPLSPISFLQQVYLSFAERTAIVHGSRSYTWAQTHQRCHQLAAALEKAGVRPGDAVSVMLPNVPEMIEAHFGIALCGGVINTINTRLEAKTIAYILAHCESKVVLIDREYSEPMKEALGILKIEQPDREVLVVDVEDSEYEGEGSLIGSTTYDDFISQSDGVKMHGNMPADEWNAYAVNYTSGTTGRPEGVVYSHRGTYLAAVGNGMVSGLDHNTKYLWTLPLFHCNGWTFPYTVTAFGGTHVCLRSVSAEAIVSAFDRHGVNALCAAPIVLNMLTHYYQHQEIAENVMDRTVNIMTAGAPPPPSVIRAIETLGFKLVHSYGLTETYGPAVCNVWQDNWEGDGTHDRLKVRQGVAYPVQEGLSVLNATTGEVVANDGQTMGEIVMRGNIVMKGYLKNQEATQESFKNGWFWTGDLGVLYPDRYIELKDRSKDLIISGGENISSVEVERAIYNHPAVGEAAVVAKPHEKWGETPCAFVEIAEGMSLSEEDLINFCRKELAGFKCPTSVIFGPLPKTSTGKIQKVQLRQRFNTQS